MALKKQWSIRDRLLYSFFLTTSVMCVIVLYSFVYLNSLALSVTKAYKTNMELIDIQNTLDKVESSIEQYIKFRTFESIESYFMQRGKIDSQSLVFATAISPDPLLLLEYKTKRLMESYLEYADQAVFARRSNNSNEYIKNYTNALSVYSFLSSSINELNALYFQRNIRDYNIIFNEMKKIEWLSIAVLLFTITLNFIMVYLLIIRITGPLVNLSKAADRVTSGDFTIEPFNSNSHDEVGNIYRAFDRMILSIKDNIETIREKVQIESSLRQKEIEARELYKDAQLRNLQSQINPHFLFNTLNAGAQLAMMEGADNTCAFIEKTADFFRYNIKKSGETTILSEEISLVDNYMYIMKVRYADRLEYTKEISTQKLDVVMPSMILQPLAENCIKHGISGLITGGIVRLRIFECDDILTIEISDNGPGFTSETRDKLLRGSYFSEKDATNSLIAPSLGIGMINVITRLKMFFKYDDVFDIKNSNEGTGTIFLVRIRNV